MTFQENKKHTHIHTLTPETQFSLKTKNQNTMNLTLNCMEKITSVLTSQKKKKYIYIYNINKSKALNVLLGEVPFKQMNEKQKKSKRMNNKYDLPSEKRKASTITVHVYQISDG